MLTPTLAESLARTALAGITREYPNQIVHAMASDADAGTPRRLHPAFYGSYDWHSAVHSHWCLARLLRVTGADRSGHPGSWQSRAFAALDANLTAANLAVEAAYVAARPAYERPYGQAWLLQLDTDLALWRNDDAERWRDALLLLAGNCAMHLTNWLGNLTHPVRTGVHSQSAFALSLAIDWAHTTRDLATARALTRRARELHADDPAWSFAFEPSGEDFLSPGLAAADLMRRVLAPAKFADWLTRALPDLHPDSPHTLAPVAPRDAADGRLAHLDGLSLSRAWMLEAIADALPPGDRRTPHLRRLGATHLNAGLTALASDDYNRTHWLASFATYALTRADPARPA